LNADDFVGTEISVTLIVSARDLGLWAKKRAFIEDSVS